MEVATWMGENQPRLWKGKSELTMVFVSSDQMKKINGQFRNKNKDTDVLSFSSSFKDVHGLGELVFSVDKIRAQASQNGWSLQMELKYLSLHGLLHLLGLDHERSPKEAKKMYQIQNEAFTLITGVPVH